MLQEEAKSMQEQMMIFIEKAMGYLLAPFSSWSSFRASASGLADALLNPGGKIAWPYLLTSIVIAYLVYWLARKRERKSDSTSFFRFAFPREIYLHRSAMTDYKYVAIDLTIQGFVYAPLVGGASWLIHKAVLSATSGAIAAADLSMNIAPNVFILTLIMFLVADFGFFLSHYFMHRIPLLWYFHEVHHSAEVMTPVTVLRVHPVENVVNALTASVLGGTSSALYAAFSQQELQLLTVFGINVFFFYFLVFAVHLRHSHIWLSYGPILSHVFLSPAQHQIHHSIDPKHYDKNYGYVLAIWDILFGSLYVPRHKETLQFGLVGPNPEDFSTVSRLYFLPFKKALGRRSPGSGNREHSPAAGNQPNITEGEQTFGGIR